MSAQREQARGWLFDFFPRWRVLALALTIAALALGVLVGPSFAAAAAPRQALATPNAIQQENSLPGDPSWNDFASDLNPLTISGYGSKISLNHGDSLDLFVTTTAPTFTISVYRTGWYGGTGARLMTTLGPFTGVKNAIPNPDPVTGIVVCNWPKTTTLAVPSTWVSGVYLARLNASTGNKSFIYFVVRNDGGTEGIVAQTSVTTYQAYNTYGGTSLYNNLTNGSAYKGPHATKVSFDRPFNPGDSNGAGHYLWFEYPFVRWAESQGLDLTYITNVDTDTNVNPLTNHKVFVSLGHDEYWSGGARNNLLAAINAGVNAAFFSANSLYWQIRFEPSASGAPNRVEVGYKDFATDTTPPGPDPQWNVNNSIVTVNWRDPLLNEPENGIIGIMYEDQLSTASGDYVVQNASHWIYANTGFTNGTVIPGIVGYEYDAVFNNGFTPPGLVVLSNSPVSGQHNGPDHANSSIYTAASGARVFASGTIEWSYGLDNYGGRTTMNAGIQQTTLNILYTFMGQTPPIITPTPSGTATPTPTTPPTATATPTNTPTPGGPTPTPSPTPTPLPGGVYAQDGFESGLGQWTTAGSGSAAVESTVVNTGTQALSLTNATGQTTSASISLAGGAATQVFTRFYLRVGTGAATSTVLTGRDASGTLLFSVYYDQGRTGLDAYIWNGARVRTDLYTPTGVIAPNTWYAIELQTTFASAGHTELWLNGVSQAAANADLSGTGGVNKVALVNEVAGTMYYDDVRIANAYSGPIGGTVPTPTPVATATPAATATPTLPPGPTPTPLPAGTYLVDGFENGLSQWTPGGTGSTAIQSAVVNSGTGALAFTDAASQYAYATATLQGATPTSLFTRFYVRVAAGTGTTTLLTARDASNVNQFTVVYDQGRNGLDMYVWNGARARFDLYTNTNVIAANTWYSVEVQTTYTATGHAELWINGVSQASVDGDLSGTTGVKQLLLFNEVTGTVYYDDIIASSQYNGPLGGPPPTPTPTATPVPAATATPTPAPAATPTATPLPAGTYLVDGFENGLSQWTPGGTGSAVIQSAVVNSGTGALALTNAAGQYALATAKLPSPAPTTLYTRFYVRIAAGTGTTTLVTARDASNVNQFTVVYDQGRNGLDIYIWNGARARFDLYTNTNAIATNTWYSVELQTTYSATGHAELWINGVSQVSVDGDLSGTAGVSQVLIFNEVTGTVYYDDIRIANTHS